VASENKAKDMTDLQRVESERFRRRWSS